MLARHRKQQSLPGRAIAGEAQHFARKIVETDCVSHPKGLKRIATQNRSACPNVAHQHLPDGMVSHGDQFPNLLAARDGDNFVQ